MRGLALATYVLAACGREGGIGLSTGPGVTTVSISSSTTEMSSASSTSTGGTEDSSAGSSGSSPGSDDRFDMGVMPDFQPPPGCKGKIDFLFLISRQGSMKTEQEQLLASLPGFLSTIEATFPDFDSHIMVANPEGIWPGWACEVPELCGTKPYNCDPFAPGYKCGPETWDLIKPCDETLGAGILFNIGPDSANVPCVLAEGRRYMVLPGEPEPATAFDCIARVGNSGYAPPIGEALVAAISTALNADDGCNAGFLRPDALLVVTMITDKDDYVSTTSPAAWYEAVVTAKGDPGSVVMLAIQPQPLVGEPQPGCAFNDGDELALRTLINMFPFHEEGDCCAESYVPFFEAAAGRVAEACNSFVPQ